MIEIVHSDYEFGCPDGEWEARLDGKKWGRAANIVLYFTHAGDGKRYWLSAFQSNDYGPKDKSIDFSKEEAGSVYQLRTTTVRGKPAFLSAKKIAPGRHDAGPSARPEGPGANGPS